MRISFSRWSAIQCRDIAPGAQTERRSGVGPVRGLLGGKDLTGRFAFQKQLAFLLLNPQQRRRFRPETAEFFIVGLVLVHPLDRLIEPLAGLLLVAETF